MRADFARMRAHFEAKKDEVNVRFLDNYMAGKSSVAPMATEDGPDAAKLYAAQKRRKRVLDRFLAEKNGVPPAGEEDE
jgi:hypothetical protein